MDKYVGTLRTTIGYFEGDYFGECVEIDNQMTPRGRGAMYAYDDENGFDKWVLGYTENGEWAVGSWQFVIDFYDEELRVHKIERSRDGALIEVGRILTEKG